MTPAVPDPTVEALAAFNPSGHRHGCVTSHQRAACSCAAELYARAAPDALRVAVEALAVETEARMRAFPSHVHYGAWSEKAMDLRALLEDGGQ